MSGRVFKTREIDRMITFVPLSVIVALCVLFFFAPAKSNEILGRIRFVLGDTFGSYYLIIGLLIFLLSIYIGLSRYGNIVIGEKGEKPMYSFFSWGAMMFTCGLAADILFYSFSEWFMYANDPHILEMGDIYTWASVYPVFHWSLIPWSFYLVLAVSFGFMMHVRKIDRQKYSEACRPLLGKYTDGFAGRIIDLLAVFALLAGTATTFSVATPLIASIINRIFGLELDRTGVTLVILVITCIIYTYSLLHGFRGIRHLANACIYMFFGLLLYVLFFGGQLGFILDQGLTSIGLMIHDFIELATFTDPGRNTSFPQNWTIYYWAYWMVWCVAAPFFIGSISKGRTIRQVIFGGYLFGVGSTLSSFLVLGNYSLGLQISGLYDFVEEYAATSDAYSLIVSIIDTLPFATIVQIATLITMIAFYATSFDSIALTASCYSYKRLAEGRTPDKKIELVWCILLILLPMALIFSESSMHNLQSVSIIAAFPIGLIMVLIIVSFLKDARKYLE